MKGVFRQIQLAHIDEEEPTPTRRTKRRRRQKKDASQKKVTDVPCPKSIFGKRLTQPNFNLVLILHRIQKNGRKSGYYA
jgi:hypothetical protein